MGGYSGSFSRKLRLTRPYLVINDLFASDFPLLSQRLRPGLPPGSARQLAAHLLIGWLDYHGFVSTTHQRPASGLPVIDARFIVLFITNIQVYDSMQLMTEAKTSMTVNQGSLNRTISPKPDLYFHTRIRRNGRKLWRRRRKSTWESDEGRAVRRNKKWWGRAWPSGYRELWVGPGLLDTESCGSVLAYWIQRDVGRAWLTGYRELWVGSGLLDTESCGSGLAYWIQRSVVRAWPSEYRELWVGPGLLNTESCGSGLAHWIQRAVGRPWHTGYRDLWFGLGPLNTESCGSGLAY
ncbi:hypothetical protein RRG08_043658 [Elysia crispata]|uniref:Uncharacterized protein n=1 Tax=Elysia crispata TaxID=231223 RepID=A0AAE0ZUM2_9GAST|nr:hypothetical protein RRG08_043658 [Elysia crispata]